jgi:hypothetical protein
MKLAAWLAAAALPLAAQPKLLVNAQVDTRPAASGLASQFQALTAAQPQPAWIGYETPVIAGRSLGCELVSPNGSWAPGVVHLEPPDRMWVLFHVKQNAVERVRTLSPDCQIDAGGVPVHWLNDVKPPESVTLLIGMVSGTGHAIEGALAALALHADPAADAALEGFVAPSQPEALREQAVFWLGLESSGRRLPILQKLLAGGMPEPMEQRAISGLGAGKSPPATDLLIQIAHGDPNSRMRAQAVGMLSHKSEQKAVDAILAAVRDDADPQVRRRAVSALQALPDLAGVPLLIQIARTSRDADVRKQAVSCLGQTRDPRATSFFVELLAH